MNIKKIIKLLKDLPEDAGLAYEENWDNSPDTIQWRKDVLEALEETIKILKSKNEIIGNIEIEGKNYKIIK